MKHINEYNSFEKNLLYQGKNKAKFFIASLIRDLEIRYLSKYHHRTFFVHKESGKVWMEDNKKSGILWVSYEHIWLKVGESFSYTEEEISTLIKHTVEVAFKVKVGTPDSIMGNVNYQAEIDLSKEGKTMYECDIR